jgi:hypothetical protein
MKKEMKESRSMKPEPQNETPANFDNEGSNLDTDTRDDSPTPKGQDLPTNTGGDRDDWRGYFPAAVGKTLDRREKEDQSRARFHRLTARFARTLAVLIFALFVFAANANANTYQVTTTADNGDNSSPLAGSLRKAIKDANANVGTDTIVFQLGSGVKTITVTALLVITDPVIIDGTSQSGYAGTPIVELTGNGLVGSCLYISAGSSTIKGLVINSFVGNGIRLIDKGNNTIINNYIGISVSGTAIKANTARGISIESGSSNNVIGGPNPSSRNVISGNGEAGIVISANANGNQIQGNFIGTNASGTAALSNGSFGLRVFSSSNTIGGAGASAGNLISGNGNGIALESPGGANTVMGNLIGTTFDGSAALGNLQDGVFITGPNNVIGGLLAGARNVISGNGDGVNITGANANGNMVQGNLIGTNANGTAAVANSSSGVLVHDGANNVIGGTIVAFRNIISGNGAGVSISGATATGNSVQGNYIGVNAAGTAKLMNDGAGIYLSAPGNFIGGTVAGAGNLISGNKLQGIAVSNATGNEIKGNLIGTDAAGTAALGNGDYGIVLIDSPNTIIGGTTLSARNLISGNGRGLGIVGALSTGNAVQGNYIGVDLTGTAKLTNNGPGIDISGGGNFIGGTVAGAGNLISGNTNQGIVITNASGNQIKGNLIGTNAAGTAALGNGSYGIRMFKASSTIIGGTTVSARNIISGNGGGISVESGFSENNLIQGNYIGVDVTGNIKMTNGGSGIALHGPNNTIGGTVAGAANVISGNLNDGIDLLDATAIGNKIQGNLIGTNATGTVALGNTGQGIRIIDAGNSLIGGTVPGARNIISANSRGVTIEGTSSGNVFQGNYIGTDVSGSVDLGNNQEGILIYSSHDNTIGGTVAGARNLISGNDVDGIRIDGAQAFGNLVQGNFIGTKADGVTLLPNALLGVEIYGASKNIIGGTAAGAGNTVAGNNYAGVLITSGVGNAVLGNSIFSNARLGIEIEPEDAIGLLENDPGDSDFGSNWRQNYPLLTSVTTAGGNTSFQGKLNSNPNKSFRIEFFSNTACDQSGFGEGQTFLGSTSVTTDASGNATISASLPGSPAGQFVTATATSPGNDTSEFSPCALVGGPNPGVLQFESSFFLVEEALGTAKIIVTRTSGMNGPVTVHYATSDMTANSPADYTATSGTLNFADGEVIKTFTIPIVTDSLAEAQETLALTLSAPTGGASLGANSSVLYINSADPTAPGLSISNATVVEGDSGTVNAVFTVSLTPHSIPVTVNYTTASGLAQTPDDYQLTSGNLIFNPGELTKTVSVPVMGDSINEGDEMFFLNPNSLSAGYVIKGQGQGTIIDDDGVRFRFGAATHSVSEGGGSLDVTVLRSGDSSAAASVNYATSDGTAMSGQDYTAASGTLSFAAGETSKTFPINITEDQIQEGDETLNLTLSNPSGGALLSAPGTAVVTIVDNEQAPGLPELSIANVTQAEGNSGLSNFTFKVTLSAVSNQTVTVHFATHDDTAAGGIDYDSVSGMLAFLPGDTVKTIDVPVHGNTTLGPNRSFKVNLGNVTNATLGNNEAVGTIVDDDAPLSPGSLQFGAASFSVSESGGQATIVVSRTGGTDGAVSVAYDVGGGTATEGSDYTNSHGTLSWANGETADKSFSIAILNDSIHESSESLNLILGNPVGAQLGAPNSAVLTITDDDAPPRISINDVSMAEGNSSQTTFVFDVTLSAASSEPITIDFATAGGSATGNDDYQTVSGSRTFNPGETSKSIAVAVNGDATMEADETFDVQLSNPVNASISKASGTGTINNDDAPPTMSISDVAQNEGDSGTTNVSFDVTLSAAGSQTITVDYLTVNGSAFSGSDFQAASGTLSFAPGETTKSIVVAVNGDHDVEADEAFVVSLSNPANATTGKSQGTGTIVNDDSSSPSPTIQFSQPNYSVQEDLGAMTVTVTRGGDTSAAASVDYETVDGSGTQKTDFEYAAGTLNFAAGQTSKTIVLLINEDAYVEGNETFSVKLSKPAGASLGQQSSANVSITDDLPESSTNPIDDAQSFVYTNYHDFLNREPDQAGLDFWTNQITSCGNNVQCLEEKRINVSASFFLSIEFQETGYLRYLLQKESFGSLPKYAEFMRDLQQVSRGVVVNSPGWQQKLADNQNQFAAEWVNRPAFKAAYDAMSNADFVNALYANAGVLPTQAERESLVNALDAASESRASILLDVAQNAAFRQKENNAAFVLMQYFGYLRRDPNAAPDADMSGYNFWLNKLNQFGGNYVDAEMIKAFITSFEYRGRFAQ